MSQAITSEKFIKEILEVFEEIFETHHGIFLDRGTSLFETLQSITAAEASRPVGGKCATLAAQVAHITFYIEVIERYLHSGLDEPADWGEIWRTVHAVTPAEWEGLRQALKQTYLRVYTLLHNQQNWNEGSRTSDALAIMVHSAYHLGEIRQALCILK
jgi:hypothetical protein